MAAPRLPIAPNQRILLIMSTAIAHRWINAKCLEARLATQALWISTQAFKTAFSPASTLTSKYSLTAAPTRSPCFHQPMSAMQTVKITTPLQYPFRLTSSWTAKINCPWTSRIHPNGSLSLRKVPPGYCTTALLRQSF